MHAHTGFTLVETMIAVTLALILTLLFGSGLLQPKNTATADARAQTTLSNANTFQQTYAHRNGTYYAGPADSTPAWAHSNIPESIPSTVTLTFVSGSPTTYCAEAKDANSPNTWSVIPGVQATAVTCANR